jgi:hypothetical protein
VRDIHRAAIGEGGSAPRKPGKPQLLRINSHVATRT